MAMVKGLRSEAVSALADLLGVGDILTAADLLKDVKQGDTDQLLRSAGYVILDLAYPGAGTTLRICTNIYKYSMGFIFLGVFYVNVPDVGSFLQQVKQKKIAEGQKSYNLTTFLREYQSYLLLESNSKNYKRSDDVPAVECSFCTYNQINFDYVQTTPPYHGRYVVSRAKNGQHFYIVLQKATYKK